MAIEALQYPLVNGRKHGFASIEMKINGLIYRGFKSIKYGRKRTRELVRGNHPDPIAKTVGENEYTGEVELYLAEWYVFQDSLGDGNGYGDVPFIVLVTYGQSPFVTRTDTLSGCSMDSTDADNSQGPAALTRKVDIAPLKILFNGKDDVANPLAA